MNHAMTVGAQDSKVGRHVIGHRHILLERQNRFQMVCFNKAFADRTIAFHKVKIAGLATGAVELFGLLWRASISLNLSMKDIFAFFDDRDFLR
jgi:hypothetical protein